MKSQKLEVLLQSSILTHNDAYSQWHFRSDYNHLDMATAIEPDFNCNSSNSSLDAGSLEKVRAFDEDSEVPETVLVPKKVCQFAIYSECDMQLIHAFW